ncbi:MAG: NAD-dependent epimerase/dehydratase family protein [Myxococcales bacterium]|nr:NAD-dependent epimerase/dehydratase family protein [Myxococcales bacterium]
MRVLLTGMTGFLGSHVAHALLAAGHEVTALVRPQSIPTVSPQLSAVGVFPGDVTDPPTIDRAVRGCEAVIHVAGVVAFAPGAAERQREINVEGTRHVLEAARAGGVRRMVHTSSVAAIGRPAPNGVADEETRYDWPPGLPYNETKRDSERLVRRAEGIETVCLNPSLVFGPGEVYRRTLTLFRLVKYGLLPLVPPGGTTLCDVRDVAEAHVAALTRGEPGARYITGGPHLTFRQLATEIAAVTNGARPMAELPAGLVRAATLPLAALERVGVPLPVSIGNVAYLTNYGYYSSERAIAALGYRTRTASETLGDAARWYASTGSL